MPDETQYMMTKDGQVIPIPEPSLRSEGIEEVAFHPTEAPAPEVEEEDELADLFEVPQPEDNDMATDHLVALPEEDDLSDLTSVSREDIMGEPYPGVPPATGEEPRQGIPRRVKRTGRRYYPTPPTSIGGVRY